MVMRNRHDGSGTPQWWDDLPPRVRCRISRPTPDTDELPPRPTPPTPQQPREPLSRVDLLLDLSRFAMLFFLITVVILLYLLVALSYVNS